MTLTRKQLEVLLTAPPEYNEDGVSAWDVEPAEDGRLEIVWNRFRLKRWSRFITLDGEVERWDGEMDRFVPAKMKPLMGSYETSRGTTTFPY